MRYVIIGAGAIGGALGGRLAHAGVPTTLVARGEHLAVLRERGLRLRTPELDTVVGVHAVGGPAELTLTPDDVLVLSTKTQQAADALAAWSDVAVAGGGTAGERLPMLTALNGVASERMAARYVARVFGVCVWMPALHLVPGEVVLRAAPRSGMLHVGRVPATAADDTDAALLQQVRADFDRAGFDVPLPADVMPWKYRKLISNLGNILQGLVHRNGDLTAVSAAVEAEARAVLAGAGIEVTSDEDEAEARAHGFTMHPVPGVPQDVGGSTWQSLTRGTGNVETDYLNGEIAYVAHRSGQRAPLNATLALLARQAAAAGTKPGSMSADRLAARLGLG